MKEFQYLLLFCALFCLGYGGYALWRGSVWVKGTIVTGSSATAFGYTFCALGVGFLVWTWIWRDQREG